MSATGFDPSQRLGRVMQSSFATAYPSMSLVDAAQLRPANGYRGVIVVSEDDTFLGIVSEPDLELALCAKQEELAPEL
jgi:CBS domain-containing protein